MKAILEFNLPEENQEFKTASKAIDYKIALEELSEAFRQILKYGVLTEEEHQTVENIQNRFIEILKDNDITLYD